MKRIYMITLAGILAACSPYSAEVDTTARAVVQAYLTPGQEIEVIIKRETLFDDADTTEALNNLTVAVESDGERFVLENSGSGVYRSSNHKIDVDKTYALLFNYEEKSLSSVTSIPSKPVGFTLSASTYKVPSFTPGTGTPPTFPDPIEITWTNNDQSYFLVAIESIEENPTAINASSTRPAFIFRNQPSQTNSYSVRPQQFRYYGKHRVILYHLTAEYAALYENNGSSSLNIKTPYSNVANGLGIFTGINADTLELNVIKP